MRKAMFVLPTLLLIVVARGTAFGQTVVWTDQFGTDRLDAAWGVIATASDVYVAGFTQGTLSGESSAGGFDASLRHLDTSGNEIWQVQFGTPRDDFGYQALWMPADCTSWG